MTYKTIITLTVIQLCAVIFSGCDLFKSSDNTSETPAVSSPTLSSNAAALPQSSIVITTSSVAIESSSSTIIESGTINLAWIQSLGEVTPNTYSTIALASTVDPEGNLYVVGHTQGDVIENINYGLSDMFIAKYSDNGSIAWIKQWGGTRPDEVSTIVLDNGGNIYVAGETKSDFDENIHWRKDGLLAKFNSSGEIQWTKRWSLVESSEIEGHLTAIALTPNGNIVVTGNTYSNLFEHVNSGGSDLYLIEYDGNGNKVWSTLWGDANMEYAHSIGVNETGTLYLAGAIHQIVSTSELESEQSEAFIAAFNADGTFGWVKRYDYNSNYNSSISSGTINLVLDNNTNIYIAGFTAGSILTKLSSDGTILWNKESDQEQCDYLIECGAIGQAIAIDGNNRIYVSQYTDVDFGPYNQDIPSQLFGSQKGSLIYKYTPEGELIWEKAISNSARTDLAVSNDGTSLYTIGSLNNIAGKAERYDNWNVTILKYTPN